MNIPVVDNNQMKRKILTTILAVMLVFQTSASIVFAADTLPDVSPVTGITKNEESPTDTWDNYAAADFAGGTGTLADPYQIVTAEQLAHLAKLTNNQDNNTAPEYHYLLVNDIDLSAHRFIPIGQSGYNVDGYSGYFKGYFDGNEKIISGLYVDETETECYAGLFGKIVAPKVNEAPIIKNLTIQGAYVATRAESNAKSQVGILCGSFGTFSNDRTSTFIQNITVSGTIERGNGTVISGGLIGVAQNVTVQNCSATVNIASKSSNTGNNGNAGGLIGMSSSIIAKNCSSYGTITGAWCLGGFIGELGPVPSESEIDHCVSYVDVTGNDWNLGGFVGYVGNGNLIKNSVAYGNVTSSVSAWKPKVGGFAGTNEGIIQNSYAANTVKGSHPTIPAGGFVGYDNSGKTVACSFDTLKNPSLNGIGEAGKGGSNEIAAVDTSEVLENICEVYYGGHSYSTELTTDKEATCTEVGSKSKYCSRCGSKTEISEIPMTAHTPSDWITDKAAAETEKGSRHKECTVCKYVMQTEEMPTKEKYTYEFTKGQNSEWKQNSDNWLTFTVDGNFANFISVKVDGKVIDPSNYTANEGSNSITLNPKYLKTLSAGKHTIEVVFTDNSASADFIIQTSRSHTDNSAVPQTGDSGTPILPLMVLMAVSGSALVMMSKKRKSRV